MKLSKKDIKDIEYISFALENCDDYDIPAEMILDIKFDDISFNSEMKEQYSQSGYIIVSQKAFEITCGSDEDYNPSFFERIVTCCDVCQIYLKYKDGSDFLFYVPYNPVESSIHGGEIEYSNCSSCELTKNEDLIINFGDRAKCFKRKDNDYKNLIIGFSNTIKNELEEELLITVDNIKTDTNCFVKTIMLDATIQNKGYKGEKVNLSFEGVDNIDFEIIKDNKVKPESLYLAKLENGSIYVEIGCRIAFVCRAIFDTNIGDDIYVDDTDSFDTQERYEKAINCKLDQRELLMYSYNHYAHSGKLDFDIMKNAFNLVIKEEISLEYFKIWLKTYSELAQCYDDNNFTFVKLVVSCLYELYLDLVYETNIKKVVKEIKYFRSNVLK